MPRRKKQNLKIPMGPDPTTLPKKAICLPLQRPV